MAGEKVLIVEDKVVLYGQPLEALLLKRGYQVVGIAPTTADALQLCADHRPDVVLMDLEIRPIDGAPLKSDEGVRAAKGVAKINEPGVIFMTAHHVSDSLMEAVAEASPRATFLQNPFSQEQLLGSLRLALLRRRPPSRKIFVCYAHADRPMVDEMEQFFGEADGMECWDDQQLKLGDEWQPRIRQAIAQADAAILLVSIEFMNSRFIREIELSDILVARQERGMLVVPVHVGPVPQHRLARSGLHRFQGLNDPKDPMRGWTRFCRHQDGWTALCERLFGALKGRSAGA